MVVGGHQHRRAGAVDPFQQQHDVLAGVRVEVPGRLVGHQQQRPVDERAGDRHPLLLAAGELVRHPVGLALQTDQLEHLGYHLADGVRRLADHLECERDVLRHRLVDQQPEVLEHASDALPQLRHLAPRQLGHVPVVHIHIALGWHVLAQ
jgi:hypothetical protein